MRRSRLLLLAALFASRTAGFAQAPPPARPNVVVVLADDLGYGDLSAYGSPNAHTPHLDRLAAEGARLTDAYAFPTCSPSRAALLTGRYPPAVGIPLVVGPVGPPWTRDRQFGLDPAATTTLAEVLRDAGYATAIVGKWHLGHFPETLPTEHGFDRYYGIPYSNDMLAPGYPPLALLRARAGEPADTVAVEPRQDTLTAAYHRAALAFVAEAAAAEAPFFLYLAHHLPHVPLHGEAAFAETARTPLAAAVEEVDAGVGRLLAALDGLGIADETLVVFASDNGPWLAYGDHAGSAGPFRAGKATSFEGGTRVPMLWRWPGVIPAGRIAHDRASLLDVLPTAAAWAGAPAPADLPGRDLRPVLTGRGTPAAEPPFFYWFEGRVEAVRRGRHKLHLPHGYRVVARQGLGGEWGRYGRDSIGVALFDLVADPGERYDRSAEYPALVTELRALAEAHEREVLADATPAWRPEE